MMAIKSRGLDVYPENHQSGGQYVRETFIGCRQRRAMASIFITDFLTGEINISNFRFKSNGLPLIPLNVKIVEYADEGFRLSPF